MPDDVPPFVIAFWQHLVAGWEQGGHEGMAAAMHEELAKMDGVAQMLEEDANRLALERARRNVRRQPARESRARRRR
jgi:hypothetical protein